MAVASFALPQPLPRQTTEPLRVLAAHGGMSATPVDPRRSGRMPGPALGAGMDSAVIYPAVNREAKGDLLLERVSLRPSIGSLRQEPSLFTPPTDLASIGRFEAEDLGEIVDTEHSPLALGGIQLAAVTPGIGIDDRSTAARLGLGAPFISPADPLLAEGPAEDAPRLGAVPSSERAGISITGDGLIARAGAGFGAPSIPLENEPFRVATTHEATAGFDPMPGGFATDRRGDQPNGVVARALTMPAPSALQPSQPMPVMRPPTNGHPALALGLSGPTLVRAERCLAEAVYWEARSEPERGQMAVAQVVLNRANSGFYPRDVCGVVYQNAHRHLACQFTFACEGRRSLVPTEAEPWAQATRIARGMMSGQLWLADVGHATHYHATYVRPWWARSMNRLQQIGVHVFYRPRNWGSEPQPVAAPQAQAVAAGGAS
ncbi:hypothetical protein E8L99_05915 [Phreatobacter aquaticus]|uniref:Cell wall hydrolase SleB domain-containing protein n=2 Tax=Phreatobacter aquaticus TaxID=2570229 RepID=A0A4D7QMX7_9HYPH|nr:hypothetical protein E8L99_05915 [Phreatobacter aquaticus]